ncbi:MAG TPA: DUF4230 domain-containing protein [Gemmatimonadaceae bacterium]|nr:DUF4230 domain-containing protein [Gemmatimonadaceae bacterium]
MASLDRVAARRLLTWGLLAIVLVMIAVAGVSAVRRTSGLIGRVTGPPAPPRVTQQLVVERLETVAKLVASEMTLRDVVTYQQTRFGSTKRALLVVTGRVSAGIDLAQGSDVSIDSTSRTITMTLPPAQVLGVDILDVTTYDERAGLLNPFRPEDRDAMQRMVREKLISAARESGILIHADRSADRVLTELLAQDGYTVKIVRPMVVNKPTG